MKYKILLFDLDDTLMDFQANEAAALKELFHHFGYILNDETLKVYHSVNKGLWADYEAGNIPLDSALNTRFSETMSMLGISIDGEKWESRYRELLGEGCWLVDGALELCKELSATHRLFIISNGIERTQVKRLKQSGLYGYFEGIYNSQSVGLCKPSKQFFDYVISHIKDFNINETLIIGDSLKTDILGGNRAGIDTCWFNVKRAAPSAGIPSTYTVYSLAEIKQIV